MNLNPYASPALPAADPEMISQFISGRRLMVILARWTFICTVSAAPSFFWGCVLHHQLRHILAMIAGIVVFILVYTMVECSAAYRRVIAWPHMRRTFWIGYGTRLTISIIFPIALFVDTWTGMLSVMLIESNAVGGNPSENASFLIVFLTTMVQGTLLNIVLFAYMSLVWCVIWTASKLWNSNRVPALGDT